jgi:aspartate-semialdehyde dehydrogenase
MKSASRDYRVAMLGAESLLGREILTVLKERNFPVSQVVRLNAEGSQPEIPIVDFEEEPLPLVEGEGFTEAECDFIFLAACSESAGGRHTHSETPGAGAVFLAAASGTRGWVIDASHAASHAARNPLLSIPYLDPGQDALAKAAAGGERFFIAPHAAVIAISHLLLRLASNFEIERATAQIFSSASELGPEAIEELQKQTTSLLSFQPTPQDFFGAPIAFNILPRVSGKGRASFSRLEERIRAETRQFLAGRTPIPALRLIQSPIFYSLAFSLYIQMRAQTSVVKIEQALADERIRMLGEEQSAPSPIEAQGSPVVLVDPITVDDERPGGFWLWGMVDNLRLAAENAVEIAETLHQLSFKQ